MDQSELARNVFTVAALLVASSIVLLNHSWNKLRTMLDSMPVDNRRIRFNLKSITDHNEHFKHEFNGAQFVGCIFLALSFVGSLFPVFIMSSSMTGDTTRFSANGDFELAMVLLRAAVGALLLGVLCVGLVYASDVSDIYRGVPRFSVTNLASPPEKTVYAIHIQHGFNLTKRIYSYSGSRGNLRSIQSMAANTSHRCCLYFLDNCRTSLLQSIPSVQSTLT